MTTDCTMLEDSSVGVEDGGEDNEIELSLGLSIGGRYKNSRKSKPVEQKSMDSCIKSGTRLTENHQISGGDIDPDGAIDPQSKREIQALRRQEARKKREEKLKKALFRGIHGKDSSPNCFTEDEASLEAGDFEAKIRDRESRENDDVLLLDQPARKKEKIEIVRENCVANEEIKDLSLSLSLDRVSNSSPTTTRSGSSSIPVVPSQYPQPSLQYVPFTNGFVYPCVVPCWAAVSGNEATACRSFRPCPWNRNSVHSDSKDGGGNWKPVSDASRGCSSSAVSDYFQSLSPKGGSMSDTGSNSSHSQPGRRHHHLNHHSCHPKLNYSAASDDPPEQSKHSESSNPTESNEAMNKASSIPHSIPAKHSEHHKSDTLPLPLNNPFPTTHNPTPANPQTQNQDTLSLPQMPCVSTTGNGPNGKTIAGFLHRYTKTEVSIVCVCHGISFSPAEFVAHAGGIDIAHPLRHITVVSSSACGR